jgi:membrane protein implicated in regulation of membrane protease activity
MTHRPTWRSGSGVFLICIILAAIVTNMVIQTPNTVGGGAGMMFIMIVLAVVSKATFQFGMNKWQKRRDEKLKQGETKAS